MQSYLIVSSQSDFIKKHEARIITKADASSFNINKIGTETGISIEEVRKLREMVSLKPFLGGGRVIVINNIEKSSVEAQNALLKILEEPPAQTYLILITQNVNSLLPTIVSRCQIISDQNPLKPANIQKIGEILSEILSSSSGQRILLSKKYAKTKEDAVIFLDSLLIFLGQSLLSGHTQLGLKGKEIAEIINKTMSAQRYLESNVNFKATMDILFLGFQRIP